MKLKTTYQQHRSVLNAMIVVLVMGLVAVMSSGSPATAADPDLVYDLPAGSACAFDLRVEIWGSNQVYKEFVTSTTTSSAPSLRVKARACGSLISIQEKPSR